MAKFAAMRGPKWESRMYDGSARPSPPTQREKEYMQKLQDKTMAPAIAKQVVGSVDADVRFSSRAEFVRHLAALVALYPKEVKRKEAGKSSTVHQMLVRLAEPARSEWLFNYSRQRAALSRNELQQLALRTA
jgi:hypothetical protein